MNSLAGLAVAIFNWAKTKIDSIKQAFKMNEQFHF